MNPIKQLFSRPRRLRPDKVNRGVSDHHRHPTPGTAEYEEHVRAEIEHYGSIFGEGKGKETLMQPVPASWVEAESRAEHLIRRVTGDYECGHVVRHLNPKSDSRMLSLGSGPAGVEISLAQRVPFAEIVCTDINAELLTLGRQRAQDLELNVKFEVADLNYIELSPRDFDVVFCHASLHRVIELERLAEQIKRTLRPHGVLITVDVITRNGYLMWPETRQVVKNIWKTLPEKFRFNHTSSNTPRLDEEILEADTSENGMECARSEDIMRALNNNFLTEHYVPLFSLARRFFDTMYGPNYDLAAALDRSIFDWIWELDLYYLATGKLQPETFFGVSSAT